MLPRPEILTARLHPTTQQDIWARSSWAPRLERSLPMEVAIGGRRTVVGATTIPTPRRTVALTGAMAIILTRRLTMITTREPTAGKGRLTALTGRRLPGLVTIPTRARTREAARSQHRMAAEVRRRPITRTQERTRRRDKVRVRMLNGAAPMCREGTKALPWVIIRPLMEQWQVPRLRRAERRPLPARNGETAQSVKLPAATCMPGTTETFTRTQGTAGRSTTTEAGILSTNLSRTGKERKVASNGRDPRVINNGRPQRAVPTGPLKAALTGQILILNDKIWTARPRIDHVVIFQASAPRIFNAAALIALVEAAGLIGPAAAAGSAAIASVAEGLAAVIASAVEDSVAVALAGSVAAVGADGNN